MLAFSPSGEKLIGSGKDDDHTIVIYDLTERLKLGGCKLVQQKGGKDIVTDLRWRNEEQFVTVGP